MRYPEKDSLMNDEENVTITIPLSAARNYIEPKYNVQEVLLDSIDIIRSEIKRAISKRDILLVPISREDAELWIQGLFESDPSVRKGIEERIAKAMRNVLGEDDG